MSSQKKHTQPKIEVISLNDVCRCSFSIWMDRVWDILNEYKGQIHITSITSDSNRVRELGVSGRTILINGEIAPVFLLKDKINELID
ncbi:hypothetical protein CEE45_09995 [Candidatus Heimdallarchaeota archaeon B3_Heim]|nr:MAG: hypothetical protein CEE45_09995 [Candidatus Heimdallarchaeota archaeon B3_Heim]